MTRHALLLVIALSLFAGCKPSEPRVDFTGDVITDENRRDLRVEITRVSDLGPAGVTLGGRVLDENVVLQGVNVIVEGTQRGTASDNRGYFVLDSLRTEQELTFSYVGYWTLSSPVRDLMADRR